MEKSVLKRMKNKQRKKMVTEAWPQTKVGCCEVCCNDNILSIHFIVSSVYMIRTFHFRNKTTYPLPTIVTAGVMVAAAASISEAL
jgi:hypothetical protein